MQDVVLATGGGAVLLEENRRNLKAGGVVVYLRADVHELWLRTRHDKNRPLLHNAQDPRAKLQQLFEERDPLYQEVATFIVDTGGQPVSNIVHQIERILARQAQTAKG